MHPAPLAIGDAFESTQEVQFTLFTHSLHSLLQDSQTTARPTAAEFQYPLLHTHPVIELSSAEAFRSVQALQLDSALQSAQSTLHGMQAPMKFIGEVPQNLALHRHHRSAAAEGEALGSTQVTHEEVVSQEAQEVSQSTHEVEVLSGCTPPHPVLQEHPPEDSGIALGSMHSRQCVPSAHSAHSLLHGMHALGSLRGAMAGQYPPRQPQPWSSASA